MSDFPDDMPFFDEPGGIPPRAASTPAPSGIAARAMAARQAQAPDYLKRLNPEQRLAVETTEGPVLVLAGAGTGKTRVLTTRIAHILATGLAYPSQILAVTFTNKAAREMKQRIGLLIGEGKGVELYVAYQRRLKELNAADFGDLLLETLRLFLDNPDVLALYQRRFRYTLVDEYQDTNVAQYLWLRLLTCLLYTSPSPRDS